MTVLDGWVYVAYGGLDADCGDYVGAVVAAPTAGTGQLRGCRPREGGIWAPSGGTVDDGRLLLPWVTASRPRPMTIAMRCCR